MQNNFTKLASTVEAKDEIIIRMRKELQEKTEDLGKKTEELRVKGEAFLEE